VALALLVAMSVGACAPSGLVSLPASAPAATAPATPSVNLPLDLCAGTGVDCALDAGQYVAQQFQPPVGFTLDAGWTNLVYVGESIQLVRGQSDRPTESVSIVSGQLDGPSGASAAAGTTAADFVTYLRKLPGITVANPAAVLLGGLPAAQLDVHVGKANTTLFNQPATATTEDPFDLRAGETARLIAVDVGSARVLFIVEVLGTASLADFERTEVQPLLASTTFPAAP